MAQCWELRGCTCGLRIVEIFGFRAVSRTRHLPNANATFLQGCGSLKCYRSVPAHAHREIQASCGWTKLHIDLHCTSPAIPQCSRPAILTFSSVVGWVSGVCFDGEPPQVSVCISSNGTQGKTSKARKARTGRAGCWVLNSSRKDPWKQVFRACQARV